MRLNPLIMAIGAAAFSVTANATDISIFGLDLGKPFTLPECSYHKLSKKTNSYDFSTAVVCYRRVQEDEAGRGVNLADDYVDIIWPRGNEPQIARYNSVSVAIIDGNMERVSFSTLGVIAQVRDLKLLTDKFGAPTTGGPSTAQNGYGATAQVIRAEWKIGDASIYYDSAASTFDSGSVRILTAKAIAAAQALHDKLNANKQQL